MLNDNLNTAKTNLGKVKVYVGTDKKLHFTDSTGADTALNFSGGQDILDNPTQYGLIKYSDLVKSIYFSIQYKFGEQYRTRGITSTIDPTGTGSSQKIEGGDMGGWTMTIKNVKYDYSTNKCTATLEVTGGINATGTHSLTMDFSSSDSVKPTTKYPYSITVTCTRIG